MASIASESEPNPDEAASNIVASTTASGSYATSTTNPPSPAGNIKVEKI